MDGRDALLAIGMNGKPLPTAHGFPVRTVVPGLYGYVSACKWITDIEVTTYAANHAYWAERGWSQQAPIKTESRIDVPSGQGPVKAGQAAIAGVAWAQHKGIDAVEVRVDRGSWQQATLASRAGDRHLAAVVARLGRTPGTHRIEARATDATGYTQTALTEPPEPNGATGYPVATVTVHRLGRCYGRPMADADIKAVVFDLGGVLLDWDPRHLYRHADRRPGRAGRFPGPDLHAAMAPGPRPGRGHRAVLPRAGGRASGAR